MSVHRNMSVVTTFDLSGGNVLQEDLTVTRVSYRSTDLSVKRQNQKWTGKGILGNGVQLSHAL